MVTESEIRSAECIARAAHKGQIEESTGDKYIRHIERVVALVPEEAKPSAWLHDVLEDTPLTEDDLSIGNYISRQTIRAVALLTRRTDETYENYIQRIILSCDPIAIAVKVADLKDHLRPNCPERLRSKYERAMEAFGLGSFLETKS
jgi:(p)ppGpp synthase/HD superfamily hydrolase